MRRKLSFVVRWLSLSLLILVLALWFTSGHWYWHWQVRPGQDGLDAMGGRIVVTHYYTPGWAMPENGLDRRSGYRLAWRFSRLSAPNVWQVNIPTWVFVVLLG